MRHPLRASVAGLVLAALATTIGCASAPTVPAELERAAAVVRATPGVTGVSLRAAESIAEPPLPNFGERVVEPVVLDAEVTVDPGLSSERAHALALDAFRSLTAPGVLEAREGATLRIAFRAGDDGAPPRVEVGAAADAAPVVVAEAVADALEIARAGTADVSLTVDGEGCDGIRCTVTVAADDTAVFPALHRAAVAAGRRAELTAPGARFGTPALHGDEKLGLLVELATRPGVADAAYLPQENAFRVFVDAEPGSPPVTEVVHWLMSRADARRTGEHWAWTLIDASGAERSGWISGFAP
ncbi:hypothetical protein [Microbacterium sp. Marseille-Q6965]|uniref:hypothetical protein n=1 Tax=Microbacterium sp. Marseille-Q6965 TaxID=2965072 RepID=UPI0021B73EC9|nr:hypothetical protein [Microbacterium sp. Marseille-Q6965]